MKLGWSQYAPPLFSKPEAVQGVERLKALLLNEASEETTRARICEATAADSHTAACHGAVAVSGEIVLDLEDPAYSAVMVVCRVPVEESCVDLFSRWARVADMPHRERDVFHFPVVPAEPDTEAKIAEITRQRLEEYRRLFVDDGLVNCIVYSNAGEVAA